MPDRPTHTSDFIKSDADSTVFLGDPLLDNFVTALIALGGEVWANRRRERILEALLEKHGAVTREMVETYVPSASEEAAWRSERDAFIRRVYGGLTRNVGDWQKPVP